jgi:hypothetical protein
MAGITHSSGFGARILTAGRSLPRARDARTAVSCYLLAAVIVIGAIALGQRLAIRVHGPVRDTIGSVLLLNWDAGWFTEI